MMEELKTCPFCGSDDLDFIESNCEEFVLISCCDCCGSSCSENSEGKAVKSWNKRVKDNRIDEVLKLVNKLQHYLNHTDKMRYRELFGQSENIKSILEGK